ncbi:MAG: MMPL family transporter, partial [Oscillibacter sp.]|nr:MMPL family transporter [Oscillibacter sp.]
MLEKIAHWLTRKPFVVALAAFLLMIPCGLGYIATRVNYDILSYIPADLPASQGEKLLEEPFHMAATNMLIVEGMPAGYANQLVNDVKKVDGVSSALWISNLMGVQIPTEMIPAQFRDMFFSGEATMMVIQYSHAGASDETIHAIDEIRALCNEKCFLAGFSVVVKDTQDIMDSELVVFIAVAVGLALIAMTLCLESTVLPFVLIVSIGVAVVYNLGTNIFLGEISFLTKAIAAVLQLGVTVDYSIFLYHRYVSERPNYDDERDAMAAAIVAAFRSLSGSSLTTVAGFLALCFMRMTLGRDLGLVMVKGVVLGVTTVVLVLPSLLLLFDKRIEKHRHRILIPKLNHSNAFAIRHRFLMAVLLLLTVYPALYASNRAEYFYKVDETMPQDTPSIVANNKLKDAFDMASSHFIVLRDDISAAGMTAIEDQLEALPGISSVVSY